MENEKDRLIVMSRSLALSNLVATSAQNKIIKSAMASIRMDDQDFEVMEFDLLKILNSHNTEKIDKFVKELRGIQFKLTSDENDKYWIPLFGLIKQSSGTNILEARFSEEVKPFLLNIKESYIKYRISETTTSTYGYKLFQLLKAVHPSRNEWEVTVKEFRWKMDIASRLYARFTNLTAKVINPAVKECAICFEGLKVEKIKKGRSIHSLRFTWKPVKRQELQASQTIDLAPKDSPKPTESGLPKEVEALAEKVYRFREKNGMLEMPTRDQRTEPFKLGFAQYAVKELLGKGMYAGVVFRFLTANANVRDAFNACCDGESSGALVLARIREHSPYFGKLMAEEG